MEQYRALETEWMLRAEKNKREGVSIFQQICSVKEKRVLYCTVHCKETIPKILNK
jgi:hypothetical protein